jgi:DNA-binding MarR family transcriptional regulator
MDDAQRTRLFELADLILALSRHIHASKDFAFEAWTPLESAVMRYIDRNPGTTASAAADATRLISSNFSRAVRGLERKGLVQRTVDRNDARRVRLYPTELADRHLDTLRAACSRLLDGVLDDPDEIDRINDALRRIESHFVGVDERPDDADRRAP